MARASRTSARGRVTGRRVIRRQKPTPVVIIAQNQHLNGSDSALIGRIINRADSEKVSENAVLFISLLSNLTPSLSDVNKRAGMRVGRRLYMLLSGSRKYTIYEETVQDLVKFFEHAGYSSITYNVFPDRVDLRMHDRSHEYLGMDTHAFEAGIISGFLTAAKRQYVGVTEHACSNNGSDHCRFSSMQGQPRVQARVDTKASIHRFIEHVARQSERVEKVSEVRISPEYYMLAASTVLERPYQEELRHVASYIGSGIASRIFEGTKTQLSKSSISRLERVVALLGLGRASVKSLKPIKIDISFDRLHSRSEFVELSLALINGLLKNYEIGDARISREARRGAYNVRIIGRSVTK